MSQSLPWEAGSKSDGQGNFLVLYLKYIAMFTTVHH